MLYRWETNLSTISKYYFLPIELLFFSAKCSKRCGKNNSIVRRDVVLCRLASKIPKQICTSHTHGTSVDLTDVPWIYSLARLCRLPRFYVLIFNLTSFHLLINLTGRICNHRNHTADSFRYIIYNKFLYVWNYIYTTLKYTLNSPTYK